MLRYPILAALGGLLLVGGATTAQQPSAKADGITPGVLPSTWRSAGPNCAGIPAFEVHEYNPDLVILRQSGCSHFEKPFLYMLFGAEKVILWDTGAGKADVRIVVEKVIADRQTTRTSPGPELVVVHSHAHDDHTAGDSQFVSRPRTTLVAPGLDATRKYFGLERWPEQIVPYDLGGRTVDIIPIPGHDSSSIALYDRHTGILLTGDTVYPGRLYINDAEAFTRSIRRLLEVTRDKPLTHVLGNHIENRRTPYTDYPAGTVYQPDEHPLSLGRAHLLEIDDTLRRVPGGVRRTALRDLTLWPVKR
jgi:glyoxylase-like metal-dependent hydrolase (beta-lactamase superfamily II)